MPDLIITIERKESTQSIITLLSIQGKIMIEKYFLNDDKLPNLPTPHDCIVEKVSFDEEFLVFTFEKDISSYDSIKHINPNFYSLIIRYHLIDPLFDTYKWKLHTSLFGREGYVLIDNKKLTDIAKSHKLEYLYQNVGYQSIIIKLFQDGHIMIDVQVDYIEYEWIEKSI